MIAIVIITIIIFLSLSLFFSSSCSSSVQASIKKKCGLVDSTSQSLAAQSGAAVLWNFISRAVVHTRLGGGIRLLADTAVLLRTDGLRV